MEADHLVAFGRPALAGWQAGFFVSFLHLGFRRQSRYSSPVQATASVTTESSSAWQTAEEAGFDMSVVATNLERTPWERMQNHGRALAAALALRQAMKEQHADE